MIYVDNAATTYPKPKSVTEGVVYAINNYTSPNRGHYKSSFECSKLIYETRELVANFFGIKDSLNVAFTQNATESINMVIDSLFSCDDHIITSIFEHNSVIRTLESRGIDYSTIDIYDDFRINYDNLEALLKENTKAIFITHSSNILGNVVDVEILSSFCKKHNLILILDTAQSAGIVEIDMVKQGIDIICFTGHKSLFGISGIGGIVVNDNFRGPFKNSKTGGSGYNSLSKSHDTKMPEVFEAGTPNFVGIKSLYEGIKYVKSIGLSKIQENEKDLIQYTYENLKQIEGVKIYGDFTSSRTPVIAFTYKSYDSNDISDMLATDYDIATRSGFHCVALLHERIGTLETGLVRISYSCMNTMEDAQSVVKALREILR